MKPTLARSSAELTENRQDATSSTIIRWGTQPVRETITAIMVGAMRYKCLTGAVGSEGLQATH